MSYSKDIYNNFLFETTNKIRTETVDNNDCSELLEDLNTLLKIRDILIQKDHEYGDLWNEIGIDLIAIINSALSGFYRTAIIGLRSVFEMGCSSIFYMDHPIEFYMFREENTKADKYVSTLVNEFDFFKTKYIKAFCVQIEGKQREEDSIAKFLQKLYAELSDVVHGRYNKLANIENFNINYDIRQYKKFKELYTKTVGILVIMVALRLNISVENITKYYKVTGVIKNE